MPIRPVWGRPFGPAPGRFRALIYGVILAGVGLVATLGVDLTILATASPPENSAAAEAGSPRRGAGDLRRGRDPRAESATGSSSWPAVLGRGLW